MSGGNKRKNKANEMKSVPLRKMSSAMDALSEFENFKDEFLPMIRKDLKEGMKSPDLREKYSKLLTARQIQIGLMEPDSGKAMTAIKDIHDRVEGKPVEKKEFHHKLEKLSDQELDAMLLTEINDKQDKEEDADEAV